MNYRKDRHTGAIPEWICWAGFFIALIASRTFFSALTSRYSELEQAIGTVGLVGIGATVLSARTAIQQIKNDFEKLTSALEIQAASINQYVTEADAYSEEIYRLKAVIETQKEQLLKGTTPDMWK